MSEEDRYHIEEHFWVFGKGSLVLSRWHSTFDPHGEKLARHHLWVILPHFPVFCWNLKGFMAVANSIGRFILIEDEVLLSSDRRAPRTLVEMDTGDGLPGDLEVQWDGGSFVQRLDYWKVPFRCHLCRLIGHSQDFCPSRACKIVSSPLVPNSLDLDSFMEGHLFPIPLDHASADKFIGKFSDYLPVLLKFISVEEI